jgi:aryl-alcohol dehydrogenase-like predicted oxidoreductase
MTTRSALGRTGIEISPIGLGCWQFSEGRGLAGGFWEALPAAVVNDIVQASLDHGVDWFDTAEAYGHGRSEAALARALHVAGKRNGDVVIATKWIPFLRRARSILRTFPERVRYLDGFAIDLHQVHHPFALSSIAAQMNAMADLVEAGRIRAVGVSNFSAAQMRVAQAALQARGISLASNQIRYSLLDRSCERNGVLAAARELGVTLIAYSPLAQGLLSGKFHADPALVRARHGPRKWMRAFRRAGLARSQPLVGELRSIARGQGATPSQVALAWLTSFHGEAVVAIPGATRSAQAEENARAMSLTLTPAEMSRLDAVSRQVSG